jgi:mono/diheme cytochrome c family protein
MRRILLGVALAIAALAATQAGAVEQRAKTDYINYCAACHGVDGTGNGALAEGLKGKPTDLTLLSKNNGGHFPYTRLRDTIDGTWETGLVRAHGSHEMPVWGDVFRTSEKLADDPYIRARARVMNIVDYIASIQKK